MKSKMKGVFGIGLTLVLLASLTVGLAAPAGAAPGTLKWTQLTLPRVEDWADEDDFADSEGDYWATPETDVGPIATSPDGETLFAAVAPEGYYYSDWFEVLKSTDGGYSWKTTGFYDEWDDYESEWGGSPIVDIVVSPDYEEDTTVFVATAWTVYQSVDGGKRFVCMEDNPDWAGTAIRDLDVTLDDRGRLAYMVGTSGMVPVELIDSGNGTAEWSNAEAYSGAYSAKLVGGAQEGDDYAAVVIPIEGAMTLSEVTSFVYNYYFDSAGVYGPHMCFYCTENADGTGDTADISGPEPSTSPTIPADAGWNTMTIDEDTENFFWYGSLPDPTDGIDQGMGGMTTLGDFQAGTTFGDLYIQRIQIEYGWWSGGDAGEPAYVDDITVNDVTYYLEDDPDPEADPEVGVAYTFLGDVYVFATATGQKWQAQGIGAYDVLACAFSPFFADDEGISAVVSNVDETKVSFSFAYVGEDDPENGWDKDIKDAPVTNAEGFDFASIHAGIAFPDDFDPWGIGNNICFAGIYGLYHGNEGGDVYKIVLKEAGTSTAVDLDIRGVLTTLLPTATDITSIDVCGDAEEATILVGTNYCDLGETPAQFLVYYSTDSGETWIPAAKPPTGGDKANPALFTYAWTRVLMAPDFCTSGIAYAATFGDYTSAFSRTTDSGESWNQTSLIDYGLMDVLDIDWEGGGPTVDDMPGYDVPSGSGLSPTGYNADGTLHVVTQTPQNYIWVDPPGMAVATAPYGAMWKRTGGKNWERIWSYANAGVTDSIGKVDVLTGGETIFATDYNETSIWRSSDSGATFPKKITTKDGLTAVWFVSATTIYTGHDDGNIYWSTKSGVGWTDPEDSEIPDGTYVGGVGVDFMNPDLVLVSTDAGAVFISSDGGETVEKVGISDPGDAGETAVGTFDLNFATNNMIYATIVPGFPFAPMADGGVWRAEVDLDEPGDAEWERIDNLFDEEPYDANSVIPMLPALALPPAGVLCVTDAAPVATGDVDGGMWRCANPTADVDGPNPPYFEKENKGLDALVELGGLGGDLFPRVSFAKDMAYENRYLTDPYSTDYNPYYEQIWMFTDTLDSGVPLASPAAGEAGVGTLYEGQWEASVVLAWDEMTGATKYEYQVAIDKNFRSVLPISGLADGQVASLDLDPNTTYYWRVRVADETVEEGWLIGAPLISPWSEARSFKTVIGPTVARPELEAPEAGDTEVGISPTFEWSGIEWAETYEFELSLDPTTGADDYFTAALVSLTGASALVNTAWKCDIALEYETRYYWHVKAIGVDTETPWSDTGTFTTMAKPVLPPEPTPPVEIPPAEEISPAWVWAVVIIGAVLVIAVIVLIVTTRRVP